MLELTRERFEQCLRSKEYRIASVNASNLSLYLRVTDEMVHAVVVFQDNKGQELLVEQCNHVLDSLSKSISAKFGIASDILCVLLLENVEKAKDFAAIEYKTWMLVEETRSLMSYENAPGEFDGLRDDLERIYEPSYHPKKRKEDGPLAYITILLVVINVLVYFIGNAISSGFVYDQMIANGGLSWEYVIYGKEIYRLFTCMFLHGDLSHLFNNMLVLFILGTRVERLMGKIQYTVLYLASGILAGAFSMGYNMMQGKQMIVSIGASGAIMGIVGAFVWILMKNKGHIEDMSLRRVLFFIVFSIYGGVSNLEVDNMAHIGGLIFGFLLALFLYRKNKTKETYEK